MENIVTKLPYDGVTVPVPAAQLHDADEYNDRAVELEGSVSDSGQVLASADAGQLSKAMFSNGVAATSMLDNSVSANAIALTPITGASGLRLATPVAVDYSALNGAIFSFAAANTSTANVTVNIGQTVGTPLGAKSLFLEDGITQIPAGKIVVGRFYQVRYDAALDAFLLLGSGVFTPEKYVGAESETYPHGKIVKTGIEVSAGGTTASVLFAVAFPNAITHIDFTLENVSAGASAVLDGPPRVDGFDTHGNSVVSTTFHWRAEGY